MRAIMLLVLMCGLGCGRLPKPGSNAPQLERIAALYQDGKPEAQAEFESYLARYPVDDLAWTIYGHILGDKDDLAGARLAYEKALGINAKRVQAITSLGILYRKEGQLDQAMDMYRRAAVIDPDYGQNYSSMTVIALKQEKDADALKYAEKGYELDPEDPAIASNLAVAYHYNGDTANRDRMTKIAKDLGYPAKKLNTLQAIYAGDMTLRDE